MGSAMRETAQPVRLDDFLDFMMSPSFDRVPVYMQKSLHLTIPCKTRVSAGQHNDAAFPAETNWRNSGSRLPPPEIHNFGSRAFPNALNYQRRREARSAELKKPFNEARANESARMGVTRDGNVPPVPYAGAHPNGDGMVPTLKGATEMRVHRENSFAHKRPCGNGIGNGQSSFTGAFVKKRRRIVVDEWTDISRKYNRAGMSARKVMSTGEGYFGKKCESTVGNGLCSHCDIEVKCMGSQYKSRTKPLQETQGRLFSPTNINPQAWRDQGLSPGTSISRHIEIAPLHLDKNKGGARCNFEKPMPVIATPETFKQAVVRPGIFGRRGGSRKRGNGASKQSKLWMEVAEDPGLFGEDFLKSIEREGVWDPLESRDQSGCVDGGGGFQADRLGIESMRWLGETLWDRDMFRL